MDAQIAGQVLVLFILIIVGFLSYKLKITTQEASAYFSSFAMKITIPCLVFSSYIRPFNQELMGEAFVTLGVAFFVYGFTFLVGMVYPHIMGIKGPERGVHRYALFIANTGIIGLPVVAAIMGPLYLFHASIFSVPANILSFSVGAWLVAKEGKKPPVFTWKVFITPLLAATIAGFFVFLFSIPLPLPLEQSIRMVGATSTPLGMAVVGISIAAADIKRLFGRWRIYVTAIVRLLGIPALVALACFLAGIRGPLLMLPVILTAMPAGSTTSIFAVVYDVAKEEAGSILALSVILSAATIPIVVIALHFFTD